MGMRHPLLLALTLLVTIGACGETIGGGGTTTTMAAGHLVSGYAHAGPTCPVETNPPDPACADRPVANAVILVFDPSGTQVAEARTAADGTFSVLLPPGRYTLVPQPVEGLMGTASQQEVMVGGGPVGGIDLSYDTGIR